MLTHSLAGMVQPQCDVDESSLEELRDELLEHLAGYAMSRKFKIILVFDAMNNTVNRADTR